MKKNWFAALGCACLAVFMVACQSDPMKSKVYMDLKAELDMIHQQDSIENANIEMYKKLTEINDTTELSQLDAYMAPDLKFHDMPEGMPNGLEGYKQLLKGYFTAIPGMEMQVKHISATGDVVIAHVNLKGTNSGPMEGGMPPTGKSVDVDGYDCLRVENGKIVEFWSVTNEMKMMQQLGLMPTMGEE